MGNKFIIKIFVLICIVFISLNDVYAFSDLDREVMEQTKDNYNKHEQQIRDDALNESHKNNNNFLNNILGQGSSFFNPGSVSGNENEIGNVINKTIKDLGIIDAILIVGNFVFVVITSVLGLKYIFASSPDKADIKNSLITLCVGIVFFFLAQLVYDFASGELTGLFSGLAAQGNSQYVYLEGRLWATIRIVVNVCAILGVILIGLKYMFASANTRADLKTELMPMFIGIMLVFCSINVINYILVIGRSLLK